MVLNPKKCHYLCLGKNSNNDKFVFDNTSWKSNKEVILGIAIDNKLTFNSHIKNICIKANQKLCALSEVSNGKLILNNKISIQLLSSDLDVLSKKVK